VLAAMREISQTLAAHLPAGSAHARLAGPAPRLRRAELGALLERAAGLAEAIAGQDGAAGPGRELSELFRAAHAIVTQAAAGLGCSGGEQALIVPRLVGSVLRPLADALGRTPDGPADTPGPGGARGSGSAGRPGPAAEAPGSTETPAAGASPAGGPTPGGTATPARRVWDVAKLATTLRARLGRAGSCPPELAEATAALQDLAGRLAAPGEAAARLDELWQLQTGLPVSVQAERNGPYLVTNVRRLIDHLGTETRPAPQLALCRCGNSSIKPLCDGSHASSGFRDAKDPKRVPDRRDTYDGQQLTIYDNRGICQHSGLCTDRLATVFRASAEPFVAASGGRMDEIIRAVRDCPSGALSYAIDGTEARGQVDRGGAREPAVEVTKDGPYRITGGIFLAGADGAPEPRAEGASLEHYALCRCGQSQNKPFCSGMHWYVGFRDPVPPPGREPTPFEWAGGLPALTGMSRLLYERHVPADPLLAPLFADMPPDQPQRLAAWLAGALGGPSASEGGGFQPSVIGPSAGHLTEEQRARWAALAGAAADAAMLPADPAFRSVLSACVDWASRTALAAPDAGRPPVEAPRWGWGPVGPPAARPADQEADQAGTPEEPLPGPDQQVSFAAHIKPLFSERDRRSMSFAFDLWSAADVRGRAVDILKRLQDGSMPCDGAWPAAKIEVFQRWTETGMQP